MLIRIRIIWVDIRLLNINDKDTLHYITFFSIKYYIYTYTYIVGIIYIIFYF